mgnify:CR=1 FL=1
MESIVITKTMFLRFSLLGSITDKNCPSFNPQLSFSSKIYIHPPTLWQFNIIWLLYISSQHVIEGLDHTTPATLLILIHGLSKPKATQHQEYNFTVNWIGKSYHILSILFDHYCLLPDSAWELDATVVVVKEDFIVPFSVDGGDPDPDPHLPSASVGSTTYTAPSLNPIANWFGSDGCEATTSGYTELQHNQNCMSSSIMY